MPVDTRASRRARSRAGGAARALRVFEQRDLLTPILRVVSSPNGLLVTKHVTRDALAVTLALRKLVWQDRILKGTAIHEGHASHVACYAFSRDGERVLRRATKGRRGSSTVHPNGVAALDAGLLRHGTP
jgi:hypothetical protein